MKRKKNGLEFQAERRILLVRGQNNMLDYDLAALYEVQTRVLKQAVRRNRDRFPEDFMFELTQFEIDELVSQTVIPAEAKWAGLFRWHSPSKARPCFRESYAASEPFKSTSPSCARHLQPHWALKGWTLL